MSPEIPNLHSPTPMSWKAISPLFIFEALARQQIRRQIPIFISYFNPSDHVYLSIVTFIFYFGTLIFFTAGTLNCKSNQDTLILPMLLIS